MKLFATVLPASAVNRGIGRCRHHIIAERLCTASGSGSGWRFPSPCRRPTFSVMVVRSPAVSVCAAAVIAELAALVAAVSDRCAALGEPVSMPIVKLPPLVLASPAFSSSPPPNQPVMVSPDAAS